MYQNKEAIKVQRKKDLLCEIANTNWNDSAKINEKKQNFP